MLEPAQLVQDRGNELSGQYPAPQSTISVDHKQQKRPGYCKPYPSLRQLALSFCFKVSDLMLVPPVLNKARLCASSPVHLTLCQRPSRLSPGPPVCSSWLLPTQLLLSNSATSIYAALHNEIIQAFTGSPLRWVARKECCLFCPSIHTSGLQGGEQPRSAGHLISGRKPV